MLAVARHHPLAVRAHGVPKLARPEVYLGKGKATRKQIDADVSAIYEAFLHRPPSEEESRRCGAFLAELLETDPEPKAVLATVMQAVLMTPEAEMPPASSNKWCRSVPDLIS